MCGAIVTSPFDVVKTRLQSSLFRESVQRTVTPSISLSGATGSGFAVQTARKPGLLWNFVETVHIIRCAIKTTWLSQLILSQRHIYQRIPPWSFSRSRTDSGWSHPSSLNQLFRLRQFQTHPCLSLLRKRREQLERQGNAMGSPCQCSHSRNRDRNGDQPDMGSEDASAAHH